VSDVTRLWPDPDTRPLDDAALAAQYPRADRPWLRVNFVTSLDGAVSLDGYSAGLSSAGDKRVFQLLRALADAVLVAAGTVRHEGYGPLTMTKVQREFRRKLGLPAYPTMVVVSGSLDLDPAASVFAGAPVRPVVVTHDAAPRRPDLSAVADVLVCGDTRVDLAAALAALHRRGLGQVLCEGGPALFGGLTAADLVDELCLTIAPLLAGPGAGRITAGSPAPPRSLVLRHGLCADGQLLLRYTRP
jgi:riboflavin-specific deaminase-like protein